MGSVRKTSSAEPPVERGELLRGSHVVPRARVALARHAALVDEAVHPGKELEARAVRNGAERLRMEDADVAIGEPGPVARDAPRREPHVAGGVPGRVLHEDEMRDAGAGGARDRLDAGRERRG